MDLSKLTKEERRIQLLEAQAIKNKAHNLVVKIISWRTGPMEGSFIKTTNKITPSEWAKYKEYIYNIATNDSKEKVKARLAETYEAIKKRGGFE